MKTLSDMPDSFGRFLLVGILNYLLTYTVYLLLLLAVVPEISIVLSALVGLVFTTIANISIVFRRSIRLGTVLFNTAYYIIYLGAYAGMLHLFVRFAGIPDWFAPFPTAAVMLPLHYICTRFVVHSTTRDVPCA